MADEARLNDLLDLVEQARAEGDKVTEQKAIAAYRRESAPAAPVENPANFGGAGGYNPMLSQLGGAALNLGNRLGMTPENTASPIKNAFGPGEAALQFGTGGLAMIPAGVVGLGQGIKNLFSPGMQAGDRVRQVEEALTYQPRTGAGAGMSRAAGAPVEAYSAATNYVGEKATDVTGSPAVGATFKTAGDIAPSLIGARNFSRPVARTAEYRPVKTDIPTTEQLKTASRQAYAEAKEGGHMVSAADYGKTLEVVAEMVKDEGINPTLHPKSTAVMKALGEAQGKPLTLQEAETLRKIALDAEDDLNPVTRQPTPDARLAGKIVDELDDSIDALSANNEARALWARSRRSQMIDRAIERAEIKAGAQYTQAGMEHALRTEFKQLALNDRRMRGLTAAQRAAVRKVANGGTIENTMRLLGKFDPTGGVVSAAGSFATGGMLAPLTGGASWGLPVLGFAAKRVATHMTGRNVERAREALVGRGISNPNGRPPLRIPDRSGNPVPAAGAATPMAALPPGAAPRGTKAPAGSGSASQATGQAGGAPKSLEQLYLEALVEELKKR